MRSHGMRYVDGIKTMGNTLNLACSINEPNPKD
jgi:hypothetical protein